MTDGTNTVSASAHTPDAGPGTAGETALRARRRGRVTGTVSDARLRSSVVNCTSFVFRHRIAMVVT